MRKQRSQKQGEVIHAAKVGDLSGLKRAIAAGANPNESDQYGLGALHWAAQEGYGAVVEHLLRSGADVNAKDREGFTPLAVAAGEGRLTIVRRLVNNGGASLDLRIRSCHNATALDLACSWNHESVAKFLVRSGASVNVRDSTGKTALGYTLDLGNKKLAKFLQDRGGKV